jgi:hypothetical protein
MFLTKIVTRSDTQNQDGIDYITPTIVANCASPFVVPSGKQAIFHKRAAQFETTIRIKPTFSIPSSCQPIRREGTLCARFLAKNRFKLWPRHVLLHLLTPRLLMFRLPMLLSMEGGIGYLGLNKTCVFHRMGHRLKMEFSHAPTPYNFSLVHKNRLPRP